MCIPNARLGAAEWIRASHREGPRYIQIGVFLALCAAGGPAARATQVATSPVDEGAPRPDECATSMVGGDEGVPAAAVAPAAADPFRFGGALRANYIYGSYDDRRGRGPGDLAFEIFNFNADLDHAGLTGRVEYRWYDEYSVMREAWLGYGLRRVGSVAAGLVRSPFGPGPGGISTSWFFDQHGHVGLADDPDLGVVWAGDSGRLNLDLAYFLQDAGHLEGNSLDAARFTFDVVKRRSADGRAEGFDEKHQFNVRAIYALDGVGELGASYRRGGLDGTNVADDDAYHYAASTHLTTVLRDVTLISQLSYYRYNITDDTPWGTGDLIVMGGFDITRLASEAWVPAVSLRFGGLGASNMPRVDSVTPYVEWSSVRKVRADYNPSSLWTVGAVWFLGGLRLITELGLADGHDFVGPHGDYGANLDNVWDKRFNVNLGYYFDLYP